MAMSLRLISRTLSSKLLVLVKCSVRAQCRQASQNAPCLNFEPYEGGSPFH